MRIASLLSVGVLAFVSVSCGDDPAKPLANNIAWELVCQGCATSYAPHVVDGLDGKKKINVECSNTGGRLSIDLTSPEVTLEDETVAPKSRLKVSGVNAPGQCKVEVTEAPSGGSATTIEDSCAGSDGNKGCTFDYEASGGAIVGSLSCSSLRQTTAGSAGQTFLLNAPRSGAAVAMPVNIDLDNCK